MKILLILMVCVTSTIASLDVTGQWLSFKKTYKKVYSSSAEEANRLKIFTSNLMKITSHNAQYAFGKETYLQGVNQFADLGIDEFLKTFGGFLMGKMNVSQSSKARPFVPENNVKLPESVDWSKKGAVTPVKQQGRCGSCYSFSANGALEGHHFIKTGKLPSLSEQNVVDCTKRYGNLGCGGGMMAMVFEYIAANGGVDSEKSYPYEETDRRACRYKEKNRAATITAYTNIPEGNETALREALALRGPVAFAMDATEIMTYRSGIYKGRGCHANRISHAMLLVGYDKDKKGTPYWLIKNSWGTEWGEQGYMRMFRNNKNSCGVASMASYPII